MEHIIKQDEFETIKRFELDGKSIWLIRKTEAGQTSFGVGPTKKQAEKNLKTNKVFANTGIPNFITELGTTDKSNNKSEVNSVPKSISFIKGLIPLSWHIMFVFRVIIDQNNTETCVEISSGDPEQEPLRYWSDDKKGHHQQVTNCIYEFYKESEKDGDFAPQHKKLGEWQKHWYNKLKPVSI